jgi:hypothetical protein
MAIIRFHSTNISFSLSHRLVQRCPKNLSLFSSLWPFETLVENRLRQTTVLLVTRQVSNNRDIAFYLRGRYHQVHILAWEKYWSSS